jgi:diacylglycerol kinase family enzyme
VANDLVGTSTVLGVLPLGTSNDFARSLHIPMHVADAVRLLVVGRVSTIDAGRLSRPGQSPQYFVHAATAGLNVRFARLATRADLRRRLGPLTYAVAGVLALREPAVFEVEVGAGERLRLMHLSVINAPVFGGLLDLELPGADPDDRRLNVLLIEALPMLRLVRSVLSLALGLGRPIRGVHLHQATTFPVRPHTPIEVALDGEVRGQLPGTFEVVPDGLRVVTPAGFARST